MFFMLEFCLENSGLPCDSVVKTLCAMQEMDVQSLGRKDPLKEGMAALSSIRTWENPTDRGAWLALIHGVAKSQT